MHGHFDYGITLYTREERPDFDELACSRRRFHELYDGHAYARRRSQSIDLARIRQASLRLAMDEGRCRIISLSIFIARRPPPKWASRRAAHFRRRPRTPAAPKSLNTPTTEVKCLPRISNVASAARCRASARDVPPRYAQVAWQQQQKSDR